MLGRRTALRAGGCAAGLALLGLPGPSAASVASVAASVVEIRMRGNADGSKVWFDPVGVLVEPGQTLRWTNDDPGNSHTSTAYHPTRGGRALGIPADAEPWDSDYLLPGESFELRLAAAGVYDYFCVPHEEAGMVGRIVVGRPRGGPPSAALPDPARRLLPSAEEILRRGAVRIVP
jgi:plastocyanin